MTLPRIPEEDRKPIRALTILLTLVHLPSLLNVVLGGFPLDDDALALLWPFRDWMRSEVLQGRWPLWSREIFCGEPVFALGQGLLLYPPGLLSLPLPTPWATLLSLWVHSLFLAFGVYCLTRMWGLSPRSSWLGAVLCALSNGVAGHLFTGHDSWHAARAWMPWLLLLTLLFLRTGQVKYLWLLAAGFWLQFWAGYAPVSLLTATACAYVAIVRSCTRYRRGEKPALPATSAWALAVPVLTALLCGASLLPFREVAGLSVHGSTMSFQEAVSVSGSWKTFVRLLWPDFFGGNGAAQWSIIISPHEEAAYFGIMAFPLALAAPFMWLKARQSAPPGLWPLWGALLFASILAVGNHTPVYGLIWEHSGLFRSLRVPARWMDVWTLGGPLLAAAGFQYWLSEKRPSTRWFTICGALALLSAVGVVLALQSPRSRLWLEVAQWNYLAFVPDATGEFRLRLASQLQQAALLAALTGFLLAAFFAAMISRWRRASNPTELMVAQRLLILLMAGDATVAYLKSTHMAGSDSVRHDLKWPAGLVDLHQSGTRWSTKLPDNAINQGMRVGVPIWNGYDPLSSQRYWEFARFGDGRGEWQGPYQPRRANFLQRVAGVTSTLATSPDGAVPKIPVEPGITLQASAQSGKWILFRQRYGGELETWPPAYITSDILHIPRDSQLQVVAQLARTPLEKRAPAVVVDPTGEFYAGAPWKTVVWRPERIVDLPHMQSWQLVVQGPAAFVESEALSPGWKAWVDGETRPVLSGNYLFRAVPLEKGDHKLTLVYDSGTLRFGLYATLCGLAIVAGASGYALAAREH